MARLRVQPGGDAGSPASGLYPGGGTAQSGCAAVLRRTCGHGVAGRVAGVCAGIARTRGALSVGRMLAGMAAYPMPGGMGCRCAFATCRKCIASAGTIAIAIEIAMPMPMPMAAGKARRMAIVARGTPIHRTGWLRRPATLIPKRDGIAWSNSAATAWPCSARSPG
jgi:hypothetical protein